MIKCSEIMCKQYFESYSEFYLALCIGAECSRRGIVLDMTDMRIEKEILPKGYLDYFKYQISTGSIYVEGIEKPEVNEYVKVKVYFDTSCFSDMLDELFEITDGEYRWSYAWANETYKKHRMILLNSSNLDKIIMHMTGYIVVAIFLGEKPKKKVRFIFRGNEVKSTYMYVNLFSCAKTLDWFEDLVILDVDFDFFKVDIDYSIHCNNGLAAGRHKPWGIKDKLKVMKNMGMIEGSIVTLYERNGICKSNSIGKITSAILARIDEIGKDFVAITTIAVNKTKEEVELDYYSIPEENRYLFADMLSFKPMITSKMLSLYDLGIHNYFYEEYQFITLLDKKETVSKYITVDGKCASVEMSGIDAIYWLLCQYCIDFDRELYKSMYNDGKDLKWDLYGDDSSEEGY